MSIMNESGEVNPDELNRLESEMLNVPDASKLSARQYEEARKRADRRWALEAELERRNLTPKPPRTKADLLEEKQIMLKLYSVQRQFADMDFRDCGQSQYADGLKDYETSLIEIDRELALIDVEDK